MKSILVTGASGFIGTHFISTYANDYKILALWHSTPIISAQILSLQVDLRNQLNLKSVLERTKPDVILHLAGKAKTWDSSLEEMINANILPTENIFEAVRRLKEESGYNPKIIIISSAECYGKTKNPKLIDENSPFFPLSEYGLSKMFVDRLGYWYAVNKQLTVTILRSFNHTGPGQKQGFFVADMASQIVNIERGKQKELKIGNLSSVRDLLDVRDVIAAYKLAIDTDLPTGEAYNISSGTGYSMEQLLKKLVRLSTVKIMLAEDKTRMRLSDNPVVIGDNSKFKKATKWKPKIAIETTLHDTLDFWRHN